MSATVNLLSKTSILFILAIPLNNKYIYSLLTDSYQKINRLYGTFIF